MKRKFLFFISFFLILIALQVESFAYSTDPKQFIAEIISEAKEILNSGNSKKTKEGQLSEIALKTVDIKGLAYYTLGRKRKEISSEELKKYEKLFEGYFLKSFASRLTDYSEPKIDVLSTEVLNPKYTIVKSLLLATDKKPAVNIEWRVYTKNPDKPLIRDLIIEGLSLARTEKEQFASVIESNDGNVTKLFDTLTKFIAK